MNEIKYVCFGYYTDADRVFRRCVGCKFLYKCNPNEPEETKKPKLGEPSEEARKFAYVINDPKRWEKS